MNHLQFNSLLKNIPSIDVRLNCDGLEGRKEVQDEEVEAGKFMLFASFSCYETAHFDAGDGYLTPPTWSSNGLEVDDIYVDVYDLEGEEVTLTQKQKEQLQKEIEISVNSIA